MAIKRRFRYYSGIRCDIPHLRSLESAVTADFDDLISGLVTGLDRPLIIRGFEIASAVPGEVPNNIQIKVADSSILHTTATEAGSIMTFRNDEPVVQLSPANDKVIGSWASNAVNYVSLDIRRVVADSTIDQTAGWVTSEQTEVQRTTPLGEILEYRIVISTSGFGNYLPLYTVRVDQTAGQAQRITWVKNAQSRFGRLGTGGLVADPFHSFNWTDHNGSRQEGTLTQTGLISSNSTFWKSGDFAIRNLKDALDATWTRIKEITGSDYWYMDTNLSQGQLTQKDIWFDSGAGSVMTSNGSVSFTLKMLIDATNTRSIASIAVASNVATVETSYPHSFKVGDSVTLYQTEEGNSDGGAPEDTDSDTIIGNIDGTYTVDSVDYNLNTFEVSVVHPDSDWDSFNNPPAATLNREAEYEYQATQSDKLPNLVNSANWDNYYKDQVNVFAYNTSNTEVARGVLESANGQQVLLKSIQGAYSQSNQIIARVRLPIISLDVTAPNSGEAEITLDASSLYDGTNSIYANDAMVFIGTIEGASDDAYNKVDTQITIGSPQTLLTYDVSTSVTQAADGDLFLDGIVFVGTVTPSTVAPDNVVPNPDAGPVSWSDDILINSVIGARTITIAKEATTRYTNGDPTTDEEGTFTLEDNDWVAYIVVERDLEVGGAGTTYQAAPSPQTITGPQPIYDGYYGSQELRVGDYVKFSGSSDSQWRKVINIVNVGATYTITLDSDFTDGYENLQGQIVVFRGVYGRDELSQTEAVIEVGPRSLVPDNPDVFWIGYRKDRVNNSNTVPTVYLRSMELEVGEQKQINDNTTANMLLYTGALTEGNSNPTYSTSTTQEGYEFEIEVTIDNKDEYTNTVYLDSAVPLGIMSGDQLVTPSGTYTVAYPLTTSTFVVLEDITSLALSSVTYRRPNVTIDDGDNLTQGERKLDRILAHVLTSLSRPIYDESIYIQKITATGSNDIVSGDWITTPSGGLAWVVAGQSEVYDGDTGASNQPQAILVHVYNSSGFTNGGTVDQTGMSSQTFTSNLTDTNLFGNGTDSISGQLIVLPPNQRVSLPSNSTSGPTNGVVYPHASYNRKTGRGGGELLLISNDQTRECGVDYAELRGGVGTGPSQRAAIRLIRPMPEFTRMRFRNLATFGVPTVSTSSVVSLQNAYNGSTAGAGLATIDIVSSKPVTINHAGTAADTVLLTNGSIEINGVGSSVAPATDKQASSGREDQRFKDSWTATQNIKAQDNYNLSESSKTTAAVTTSGAASTNAHVIALEDNTAIRIKVGATARNDYSINSIEARSAFELDVAISRENGGNCVIIGAPQIKVIGMDFDAFEHVVDVNVIGTDIYISVAGGTGQTCHWALTIETQKVSTGA